MQEVLTIAGAVDRNRWLQAESAVRVERDRYKRVAIEAHFGRGNARQVIDHPALDGWIRTCNAPIRWSEECNQGRANVVCHSESAEYLFSNPATTGQAYLVGEFVVDTTIDATAACFVGSLLKTAKITSDARQANRCG